MDDAERKKDQQFGQFKEIEQEIKPFAASFFRFFFNPNGLFFIKLSSLLLNETSFFLYVSKQALVSIMNYIC